MGARAGASSCLPAACCLPSARTFGLRPSPVHIGRRHIACRRQIHLVGALLWYLSWVGFGVSWCLGGDGVVIARCYVFRGRVRYVCHSPSWFQSLGLVAQGSPGHMPCKSSMMIWPRVLQSQPTTTTNMQTIQSKRSTMDTLDLCLVVACFGLTETSFDWANVCFGLVNVCFHSVKSDMRRH